MFSYKRKARYHETDKMGIIHHSNFLKWMEEARTEFLESCGISYKAMEESGIISPVAEISIKYKKMIEFDDCIDIRIFITKYSGAVMEVAYDFYNLTKDEIAAKATSKHCFIKGKKLISLKKALPEADAKLRETADFKKV